MLEVVDFTRRDHLETELLLVKIDVAAERLMDFITCLRRHPRAQVLDISAGVRTAEFTGGGARSMRFSPISPGREVVEIARSGTAAIERGTGVLAVPA